MASRLPHPVRRTAAGAALAAGTLALSGCSEATLQQWSRWGMPEAITDRAPLVGNLWNGAWIASMVIGVFVWGLIGWVLIRYRKTKTNSTPRQTRYNLPLELLYTLVPFLIIGVLFFFTMQSQNGLDQKVTDRPVHTVNVVGQKWSWTFNYMEQSNPAVGTVVHDLGTIERFPDLYLPVGKPVRFNLDSADVIHSFWIPEFYFKLDVFPGHRNSFDVTPTKEGTFTGRCAELCGTYHAAMLFNVHVVSEAQFDAHLAELKAKGQVGERKTPDFPVTGTNQKRG